MIFFMPMSWVAGPLFILVYFILFMLYPMVMIILTVLFIMLIVAIAKNTEGAIDD